MDRGRKWSESSGPGPVRPRGASLDESSASSGDPISRRTSLATTLPSELAPPATGPQPVSAAQPTRVQIKPEPMDLEDKPSCRYAGQGGSAMFNLPGPSGGDGTSDSVPVSPSSWPRHNLENTDVGSVSKLPSHLESKRNKKPPVSTPPSYHAGDRSGCSPTSRFGSPFRFSGHPISSATDISQQPGTISTVSATATLSSESSLEGGEQQQSLQQDTQQPAHLQTWQRPFPSGASSNVEGASRQRMALMYKQQLLYVMKRLNRLGIGNGQEAGATPLGAQPEHNILHSRLQPVQQVDQQGSNQGVRRSRQSEEHTQHTIDVGGVSQVGQQETSLRSDTQISGGSSTATSDQSQVKSPHIRGYFMEQPIICGRSIAQSPTGMSPLSGMFGIQAQPQRGGTVQSDTTIRQLLRRTNPPYLTPVHQLHHQQQRYLQQQQHHHQQQQQQKHHPHPQHFHKPLSQRLSDGSYSAKPATVGQRRYSAPPYTSDVVMKEESGDQFSNQIGASAQLTDSTQAMESSGSEGMEPFPQKDLNHNIPTTSSNMMSMGEVCIVPPTPISDPDAVHLAEINMGSTLLDLDLLQQQQQRHGPSPSPSFGGGFGLPPSPDMQGSFYPEQHFFPQQPMGPTIQQAGGEQMSEIDENEMVRLLMREMIPDILADCHKLQLTPNLYFWSPEDVQKWLACVASRFELGEFEMGNFFMDGAMLATLQDTDFRQRAPKCGDILYSVVCLLKSSIHFDAAPQVVPQVVQQPPMFHHIPQPSPFNTGAPTTEMCMPPPVATPGDESGSTGSPSDDEVSIPSPAPSGPNTSMTPNHTGGIQLWQFLKELLLQPNSYSYCIRWMDRTQGIFKIEDSVEVARLWGLRKNRPAMNYDKLSRSIRQYYRKGIMKKTEVSQRLVYQFVHPC